MATPRSSVLRALCTFALLLATIQALSKPTTIGSCDVFSVDTQVKTSLYGYKAEEAVVCYCVIGGCSQTQ